MKLSQEQIQNIDKFLIKSGVKYWDIRLELADHFINAIEEKMGSGLSYDESFLEVHKSFGNKVSKYVLAQDFSGWNKENGIYVDNFGYQKLLGVKRKELHKQYNRQINRTAINWIKSPSKVLFLVSLVALLYLIFTILPGKASYAITALLVFLPTLLMYIHQFRFVRKRHKRSLYFEMAMLLSVNGLWIGYPLLTIPQYLFSIEIAAYPIFLLILIILVSVLISWSGFIVYKNELSKCNNLLKKLELN
ncbi:hypothetical protein [Spongiivirga citrea]|uniref:Uncharacterized protein n=1 Tax=Spongiivirga citrea TaxID=1481457 RepID=A0A6M0CMP1_9FLAO|nr:hypothetical protein [Spongiivirga citrea]NER18932.1 hypothetical protein [Spongiivirga citrea]